MALSDMRRDLGAPVQLPVAADHVRRMKLAVAMRWGLAMVLGALVEAAIGGGWAAGLWGASTAFAVPWILVRERECVYIVHSGCIDLVCPSWPYSLRFALLRSGRNSVAGVRRSRSGALPTIVIELVKSPSVTLVCDPACYEDAWVSVSQHIAAKAARGGVVV